MADKATHPAASIDGLQISHCEKLDDDSLREKDCLIYQASGPAQCWLLRRKSSIGILAVLVGVSALCFFLVIFTRSKNEFYSHKISTYAGCKSPTIDRRSIVSVGVPLIPDGFTLKQATVHQRHLDRWMYQHDFIDNFCWDGQENSTNSAIEQQCNYNLSSVWENFKFTSDPYSKPLRGSCNPKQLTIQGQRNAETLGEAYRDMFTEDYSRLCEEGGIKLESDAEQKNQHSTQYAYKGICGAFPEPSGEFAPERVLDNGSIARGRPFFLRVGLCRDSDFLSDALEQSKVGFLSSHWILEMRETAKSLARVTGKEFPQSDKDLAVLEDNVEDCLVSHFCHGLDDVPAGLWPILDDVDRQETASRIFMFDFFSGTDDYKRFVSTYFGYYFVVLLDRMQKMVQQVVEGSEDESEPLLYLQVTSDDRLSALLRALDAPRSMFSKRPTWGSQIIFQLLEKETGLFHVRILYNGEEIRMQSWEDFKLFVAEYKPTKGDCARFYNNYP